MFKPNEPMPEVKKYVERLKNNFEKELGHVMPDRIIYSSFSKKNSREAAKIGPIPKRFSAFLTDYDYFMEVHKEAWELSSEGKRLYIVLHELNHIPEEGFINSSTDYRKLIHHNIEDFSHLLLKFGVELDKVDVLARKCS